MAGVAQNMGCEPILINGVEDHVHIPGNLSRTATIARVCRAHGIEIDERYAWD
jgi:hypothetical protein